LIDRDRIRAVILGTGVNSDGRTIGLSLPSEAAQAALIRTVYARAGVSPDDLAFFEMHGTGTPAGDPIEAAAVGRALGQARRDPLPIGSVKTNIGHLEPASGLAGLIKATLALDHGIVPPTLHCERPNPNIAFDESTCGSSAPRTHRADAAPGSTRSASVAPTARAARAKFHGGGVRRLPRSDGTVAALDLSARTSSAARAGASWHDTLAAGPEPPCAAVARRRDQHQSACARRTRPGRSPRSPISSPADSPAVVTGTPCGRATALGSRGTARSFPRWAASTARRSAR
jgi:hypothetical protein